MPSPNGPLRVGIGGPVGSGKTALMETLCKAFRDRYDICAITNDIYTKEDALILTRAGALPVPVSYTHLDVYKRQEAHRARRQSGEAHRAAHRAQARNGLRGDHAHGLDP